MGKIYNEYEEYDFTPIEEMFAKSFDKVSKEFDVPLCWDYQFDIVTESRKYFADFWVFTPWEQKTYDKKLFGVLVECDGHEFHEKTKEQVAERNEKDFALLMNGFETIHFSGSQIYADSERCARKVCEYVVKRYKELNDGK